MSVTTSQQLVRYYTNHRETEVAFNREVIDFTGLLADQAYLKIGDRQTPCVIYSSSMVGAKLITNLSAVLFERMREANNVVSLRFAFRRTDNPLPLSFFVSCRIGGFNPYSNKNPKTHIVNVAFIQKPPDDLIEVLGRLLDIRSNMAQRKNERIVLTEENARKLRIKARDGLLHIDGKTRKSIIRDISLSGAKVFSVGLSQALVKRAAMLTVGFADVPKPLHLPARIVRFEPIEGRDDIAAVAMAFDDSRVPPEYKLKISRYFG